MTFKPEYFGGCEAAKIAPLVVPYVQGKCLDIGSGPGKLWPRLIGIDIAEHGGRLVTDMKLDATDLSLFGDNTLDGIFSSFAIHHIDRGKIPDMFHEWGRKIKVGGYMTLYLPNSKSMMVDEQPYDPQQKWQIHYGDVECLIENHSRFGWDLILSEKREANDEYGFLLVVRKRADDEWHEAIWRRNPEGKKRALVIRMGAIGDSIIAAGILPHLKAKGYHVTFNCTPATELLLRHDPNIDEWLVQATDFVPNEMLGPYWNGLKERYDTVINLSESVEGLLLTLPGRLNHSYSDEARRAIYSHINYSEHSHNIADVPHDFSGAKFYATEDEVKWAKAVRNRMDGPVVCWAINGSSIHKVYGWTQVVCKWLLEKTRAHVMLYADPGVGKALQDGIMQCLKDDGCDMARIHGIAGKWDIRQSLAFAQIADCVVGPETGPLNAMAMEAVPKVIYLSHSTPDNLTKHWQNTTVLEPEKAKAKCYPCHRLHHDWEYCFKHEATGTALCTASIKPDRIFKAIALAVGGKKK